MYVHSFSYLLNKLELGGYTYLQLKVVSYLREGTRDNFLHAKDTPPPPPSLGISFSMLGIPSW